MTSEHQGQAKESMLILTRRIIALEHALATATNALTEIVAFASPASSIRVSADGLADIARAALKQIEESNG